MSKIAFLGLGAMGSRMVSHLVADGHKVTVWNRSKAACKQLAEALGQPIDIAESPAKAAADADYVISMVRDDVAAKSVWLDEEIGAINSLQENAVAIECSTLTPAFVQKLAARIAGRGANFCDAPLAGSRPQAEARQLIFFIGGSAETYGKAKAVLEPLAGQIHHVGNVSQGATVKLLINALFGVQLNAMAEIFGILKKTDLNVAEVLEVIAGTPVCSPAAGMAVKAMAAENFAPAFPIELVVKDFSYIQEFSQALSLRVPLLDIVKKQYEVALAKGYGEDNITGIAQLYR